MKRFFTILLVTIMLVGMTPLFAGVAMAEEYATVTSDNGYGVRMREGPGKAYGVITKYDVGTTVVVLQRGTEWSQIKVGSLTGWMMNKYLIYGATGSDYESGSAATGTAATVTSGNGLRVWMRSTPGGKRLQLYKPGTAVTIITPGSKWSYIDINGARGYMMSEFLYVAPPPAPSSRAMESASINYYSPVVGDVLEASYTPADATVEYSWTVIDSLGNKVEEGKGATFTVLNRYEDCTIRLTVTGTGVYFGSVSSTTEAVVTSRRVSAVTLNKVQPFVGDVLTPIVTPSSATVDYSWRVGGQEVSTEATYTVQAADLGKPIQLKVTGVAPYFGVAICTADEILNNKELHSVSLTISDRPVIVGDVLSFSVLPAGATVKNTWMVDGEAVSETASYKVEAKDLGKKISLTVEGTGEYTGTVSTASYGVVKQASITAVSVTDTTPMVGQEIGAVLVPAGASAEYKWYSVDAEGAETPIGNGSVINVSSAEKDKQIKVRVTPTGVYTVPNADGYIDSALTAAVFDSNEIIGVRIDNTRPVVGDYLNALVTTHAEKDVPLYGMSYIWTIGNEIFSNSTGVYEVQPTDVGKTITVKVMGNNPYSGTATSVATGVVYEKLALTSASIFIQGTDANASTVVPRVGDTLYVVTDPKGASDGGHLTYEWYIGNGVYKANTATFPVSSAYKDLPITVKVTGTDNYSGTVARMTLAVQDVVPVINPSFTITAPVAGVAPSTAVSAYVNPLNANDVLCTATLQWVEYSGGTYAPAEMDSKGNFMPGRTMSGKPYVAKLTLTPKAGYTLEGATVTVNGNPATPSGTSSNIYYMSFETAERQISRFYINGLPRPVAGEVPSVTSYSCEQYTATIDWGSYVVGGKFIEADEYVALIKLTAEPGYSTEIASSGEQLPENVFEVANADKTESQTTGTDTVDVIATYNVDYELELTAERTEVLVDGVNASIVQLFPKMTNTAAQPDPTKYSWEVHYATSNNTWVQNGKLNVGADEIDGTELVVKAKVKYAGVDYEATVAVKVTSGTDTDTAIVPVFTGVQPSSVTVGQTADFSAYAKNSHLGVMWAVEYAKSANTKITNGHLEVGADETAPSVNVVVWPVEAPGERIKVNVVINANVTIVPTPAYTVVFEDSLGGAAFESYVFTGLASGTPIDTIYPFTGVPEYENGVFDSWEGGDPLTDTVGTADITYRAKWNIDYSAPLFSLRGQPQPPFTVTYTDGVEDAEVFADQVTADLAADAATPAFTGSTAREGYLFAGWDSEIAELVTDNVTYTAQWKLDANNNGIADEDEETPINDANENGIADEEETFTLTFMLDADTVYEVVENVPYGSLGLDVIPMTPPEKEGFIFDGWDPNLAWENITSNGTYTALWAEATPMAWTTWDLRGEQPATFTVTYTDGAMGSAFADQVHEGLEPDAATPAFNGTPVRDLYVFTGWSSTIADFVTENVTYEAQWAEDINLNGVADSSEMKTITYEDGEGNVIKQAQGLPGMATPSCEAPEREFANFLGWTPAVADTVTDDATYVAQWEKLDVTVNIVEENEEDVDEDVADTETETEVEGAAEIETETEVEDAAETETETEGEGAAETETETEGEAVADTETQTEGEAAADTETQTEGEAAAETETETEGEADAQPDVVTYTVTYTDGAMGSAFADVKYEGLKEGDATPGFNGTPVRDLYVFTGWNASIAETVTADATYEAVWADDFNGNGVADADEIKNIVYQTEDGAVIKQAQGLPGMPTPSCAAPEAPEGMTFAGWTPAVADTVSEDAIYTAQWQKVEEKQEEQEAPAADEPADDEEEELDDESMEASYEEQAQATSITLDWSGAGKVAYGKSSTYSVKVNGLAEGAEASVSYRLSRGDLTDTSAEKTDDGLKVTVGQDETAETFRVVATVTVGDVTISRAKRVTIVEPAAEETEDETETEVETEATEPAEEENKADETSTDADETEATGSEESTTTDVPAEESTEASTEEVTEDSSEEEMAQYAMEEENYDPASENF